MPIYEYLCKQCNTKSEIIHAIDDEAIYQCCVCHGKLTKLISAGNFNMDGKKANTHPNSPEAMDRGRELRRKHSRNDTLKEWKQENMERFKKDGQFSYE